MILILSEVGVDHGDADAVGRHPGRSGCDADVPASRVSVQQRGAVRI